MHPRRSWLFWEDEGGVGVGAFAGGCWCACGGGIIELKIVMSFQNENIGMMDEGYFVSRGDILKWLNDLLQVGVRVRS